MKNTFKKEDANGNRLPEEIGEGLNYNHPSVKKKPLDARQEFNLNKRDKEAFAKFCKPHGGVSAVLRGFMLDCIK